jgi:hypothetical protein
VALSFPAICATSVPPLAPLATDLGRSEREPEEMRLASGKRPAGTLVFG